MLAFVPFPIAIQPAQLAGHLATGAVQALLAEVRLTPKPGLVDAANNGCHHDLTLALMEASAEALFDTFFELSVAAWQAPPSQPLREQLAAIGRQGEQAMLRATGGVNTHKGAIWTLGLLVAATASLAPSAASPRQVLARAGAIARFDDRCLPPASQPTNGQRAQARYGIRSARQEAQAGFPALRDVALPTWQTYVLAASITQQLNILLALMATVDDTCILHRSSLPVLREVQRQASALLAAGGVDAPGGYKALAQFDTYLTRHWVSPGGSADLLAATLFLHRPAFTF
jgi:triphosphoribosyl-dephospho-CoA synthase